MEKHEYKYFMLGALYRFLSSERSDQILDMDDEDAIELLGALGGRLWEKWPRIDYSKEYQYTVKMEELQDEINGLRYVLPETPMEVFEAGVKLGRDFDETVMNSTVFSPLFVSMMVYRDEELIDVLLINLRTQSVELPTTDDEDASRCDEEEEMIKPWADKHSFGVIRNFFGSIVMKLD